MGGACKKFNDSEGADRGMCFCDPLEFSTPSDYWEGRSRDSRWVYDGAETIQRSTSKRVFTR